MNHPSVATIQEYPLLAKVRYISFSISMLSLPCGDMHQNQRNAQGKPLNRERQQPKPRFCYVISSNFRRELYLRNNTLVSPIIMHVGINVQVINSKSVMYYRLRHVLTAVAPCYQTVTK